MEKKIAEIFYLTCENHCRTHFYELILNLFFQLALDRYILSIVIGIEKACTRCKMKCVKFFCKTNYWFLVT